MARRQAIVTSTSAAASMRIVVIAARMPAHITAHAIPAALARLSIDNGNGYPCSRQRVVGDFLRYTLYVFNANHHNIKRIEWYCSAGFFWTVHDEQDNPKQNQPAKKKAPPKAGLEFIALRTQWATSFRPYHPYHPCHPCRPCRPCRPCQDVHWRQARLPWAVPPP